MPVGPRARHRVWLRRWLVTTGFGGCSRPSRFAVRRARTPKRLESWKCLVRVLRAAVAQRADQLDPRILRRERPVTGPDGRFDQAGQRQPIPKDMAMSGTGHRAASTTFRTAFVVRTALGVDWAFRGFDAWLGARSVLPWSPPSRDYVGAAAMTERR